MGRAFSGEPTTQTDQFCLRTQNTGFRQNCQWIKSCLSLFDLTLVSVMWLNEKENKEKRTEGFRGMRDLK